MPIHTFEAIVDTPGMKLPARSVLVNESGKGILFSPVRFDDNQVEKIRSICQVTDIVAPCLFHHLSVPRAMELFPKAKVWGAPGFKEKRKDIRWSEILSEQSWPYKDFLDLQFLRGAPQFNEVEFFYRPSRTLIATDLCFNMSRPKGWFAPILLRLLGNYEGFAVSRLLKFLCKDKAALNQSLQRVLEWDFDGIIMSHGEPVASGGKEKLRAALKARGFLS